MSKKYTLPKQTLWDYVNNPLRSLDLYFDLYEGRDFKYAKQMIQAIRFMDNLQYKVGKLFGTIFGFVFDAAPIVFGWIVNFMRAALILLLTLTGVGFAYISGTYVEIMRSFLEFPRGIILILVIFSDFGLSFLISEAQSYIWYGYKSKHLRFEYFTINFPLFVAAFFVTQMVSK